MDWFRFYNETVADKKLARIARDLQVDYLAVFGAWAAILTLASESPIRGKLLLTVDQPLTIDDVSETFHHVSSETKRLLQAFIDKEMLAVEDQILVVTNWDKRQFESDTSTSRVRKHRTSKRGGTLLKQPCNVSGGESGNVSETHQSTETDTDTEGEGKGEELKQPCNVSGGEEKQTTPDVSSPLPSSLTKAFIDHIWGTVKPPKYVIQKANRTAAELRERDDYDEGLAIEVIEAWAKYRLPDYIRDPGNDGNRPPLKYVALAIIDAFEDGTMPGDGNREEAPPEEHYLTGEELAELRDLEAAEEGLPPYPKEARPVPDWWNKRGLDDPIPAVEGTK